MLRLGYRLFVKWIQFLSICLFGYMLISSVLNKMIDNHDKNQNFVGLQHETGKSLLEDLFQRNDTEGEIGDKLEDLFERDGSEGQNGDIKIRKEDNIPDLPLQKIGEIGDKLEDLFERDGSEFEVQNGDIKIRKEEDNIPDLPLQKIGIIQEPEVDIDLEVMNETDSIKPDEKSKIANNTILNMPMYHDIAEHHRWMMPDKPYELETIEKCKEKTYDDPSTLPTVSVIISFHENEKLTHLLHTLHSIVKYSPAILLKEIIMIADNSSKIEHQDVLQNYVDAVFSGIVKIHRSNKPLGLIRARQMGVELATAEVVCSMDAHMEVQKGWLEPMLQEIKNDRKTMVTPFLDWMKPQEYDGTWLYEHGNSRYKTVWFWWNMFFTFMELPKEFKETLDPTAPIVSPCSVGTIWAMNREYFHEVGGFDMGMEFWGGENIDLPLRVFLFGGKHVQTPCSHAAHLEEKGQRNYRRGNLQDTTKNYRRIVETWFTPEYKEVIYYYNPSWRQKDVGDLSDRLHLRSKAVHNFTYYMKTFFPEMKAPQIDTFAWGGLTNIGLDLNGDVGMCFCAYPNAYEIKMYKCNLAVPHNKVENIGMSQSNSSLTNYACAEIDFNVFQVKPRRCQPRFPHSAGIFWTTDGELRLAGHIIHPPGGTMATQTRYSPSISNYIAVYGTERIPRFMHYQNGLIKIFKKGYLSTCLTVLLDDKTTRPKITAKPCNPNDKFQLWKFQNYTQEYYDLVSRKVTVFKTGIDHYYSNLTKFLDIYNSQLS